MKKLSLKDIREMSDILVTDSDFIGYLEPTHKIAYSSGKYGCNGWIRQGDKTGTLYGCAGRCSELYEFDTCLYMEDK